jgi:hypothetical protein
MKRILIIGALSVSAMVLSAFTESPPLNVVEEKKTDVSIKLAPNADVFTEIGQTKILMALNGQSPCSYGSCVCDNWREITPGNPNSGYARACGCYGEINNYWYEFKPCWYCVPSPNYGSECQNG